MEIVEPFNQINQAINIICCEVEKQFMRSDTDMKLVAAFMVRLMMLLLNLPVSLHLLFFEVILIV